MHVGVEPNALLIVTRDEVDAIAGQAVAPPDGSDWRFDDTHWPHPVSTRPYNLLQMLKHDPEKWQPVFPRDKRECVCAEIMLKQGDEIMIRFNLIGS
jgi:hypothetical protein